MPFFVQFVSFYSSCMYFLSQKNPRQFWKFLVPHTTNTFGMAQEELDLSRVIIHHIHKFEIYQYFRYNNRSRFEQEV